MRSKGHLVELLGSDYIRGIALLSGGQATAALIPIFSAPVLGRIYSPADYVLLAIFISVSQLFVVVASLQYRHAIIAEKSDRRALTALGLCISLNAIIASVVLLAVVSFFLIKRELFTVFQNGWWLLFLPLSVLVNSFMLAVSTYANRLERYKIMTSIQIVAALLSVVVPIWLGLLGWGGNGLMTALMISQIAAAALYVSWLFADIGSNKRRIASYRELKISALRNRRFPFFTLPGVLLSSMSMQVPIFALTFLGAETALGAFNRARSLVSMPSTLMGEAVGQGFRARASRQYRETGTCRTLMVKSMLGMSLLGFFPFGVLFVWGEPVIALYLGPEWKIAGTIATILAPMLYLRFISAPFGAVFQFTGRQKLAFKLNVVFSILIISSVSYCLYIGVDALGVITAFSVAYAAVHTVQLITSIVIS